MCVRVQYVSTWPFSPYDADRKLIRIPAQLEGSYVLDAVRAVLTELAVEQPRSGALCFCGEPVRLLAYVPEQRESEDQVVRHGA
ncbi:hypothetical protein [Streptomyces sp. NPDC093060]|uniref:hypothetical protein n=1 Tax=Streptomyces sp. NPDC093060 TaxID=3366019 RepID=UPI00380CF067